MYFLSKPLIYDVYKASDYQIGSLSVYQYSEIPINEVMLKDIPGAWMPLNKHGSSGHGAVLFSIDNVFEKHWSQFPFNKY